MIKNNKNNNTYYRKIEQKHKVETRNKTIGFWAMGLGAGPSYSVSVGYQRLKVLCVRWEIKAYISLKPWIL